MERSASSRWQVVDGTGWADPGWADPGWGDPGWGDPGWADPGRRELGAPGSRALAVVGAVGGCGASSLAAACAIAARAHGRPALVDLDTRGAGLDVLLGIEDVVGARWPDLYAARGHVDPDELAASLPRWRGIAVLSADRRRPADVPDDVRAAVLAGLRARASTVVLDVPRAQAPWLARAGAAGAGGRIDPSGGGVDPSDGGVDPWGAGRVGAGVRGLGARGLDGAGAGARGLDDTGAGARRVDARGVDAVALVVPVHVVALAGALAVTGAGRPGASAGPAPRWGVVARGRARGRLLPDDVGSALDLPVVARLRDDGRAPGAVERGDGPRVGRGSPLRAAAEAALGTLSGAGR